MHSFLSPLSTRHCFTSLGTQSFLEGLILVIHFCDVLSLLMSTSHHPDCYHQNIIPGVQQCCSWDLNDFLLCHVKSLSSRSACVFESFPSLPASSMELILSILSHAVSLCVHSSPWLSIVFSGFQSWLEEVLGLERDGDRVLPNPRCSSPPLTHFFYSLPLKLAKAIFLPSAMFGTFCSRLSTSLSPI